MASRASRESLLGPPTRHASQQKKPRTTISASSRPSSRPSTTSSRPGSLAPGRRSSRSSVYGVSASTVKKDPRPLSDKSFQVASIRKICAHLAQNGYPREVKPRALQSPSTKDVIYILNFLLEQIDESLVINGFKLDEEVPLILKCLGYPFSVSKHHLLSVGSPHSWPIILGILIWLVEGTLEDNRQQLLFNKGYEFDDPDNDEEEKFRLRGGMYRIFLEHGAESEEYQSALSQLSNSYEESQKFILTKLQKSREELVELEQEVELLSASSIPALQAAIKQSDEEKANLVQYINEQLKPRISQLGDYCQEVEAANCRCEMQLLSRQDKIKELEEEIRQQPMSALEARELKQQVADEKQSLVLLEAEVTECNARVSELQMQHNQSVSMIDKSCREVNDKLRKLAAILPDAASLSHMSYDTSKRADPRVISKLLTQTKTIKQGLKELNERVATTLSETEAEIINMESVKSTLQNHLTQKQLEIENMEHSVDIEKSSLQQRKKKHEEGQKAELTERHTLEKQLMALQERLQDDSVAKEFATVKKQAVDERVLMEGALGKLTADLQALMLARTGYIEKCRAEAKEVTRNVEELVRMFQLIKLPPVKRKYWNKEQ